MLLTYYFLSPLLFSEDILMPPSLTFAHSDLPSFYFTLLCKQVKRKIKEAKEATRRPRCYYFFALPFDIMDIRPSSVVIDAIRYHTFDFR